jgi:hypothetical protein
VKWARHAASGPAIVAEFRAAEPGASSVAAAGGRQNEPDRHSDGIFRCARCLIKMETDPRQDRCRDEGLPRA